MVSVLTPHAPDRPIGMHIDGSTRFEWVLLRRLFPAAGRRVMLVRWAAYYYRRN